MVLRNSQTCRWRRAGLLALVGVSVLLTLSACGSSGSDSSASASEPVVLIPDDSGSPSNACLRPLEQPSSYTLGCGQGYELSHLQWSNWGATATTATGIARVNDCTPYCAAGTFHDYPVSITLTRIGKCKGGPRLYEHFNLVFLKGKYGGITESYSCPPTREQREQEATAESLAIRLIEGKGAAVDSRDVFTTRSTRDPAWIRITGTTIGNPEARGWTVYLKSVNGVSVVRYAGFAEPPPIGGVPCDIASNEGFSEC